MLQTPTSPRKGWAEFISCDEKRGGGGRRERASADIEAARVGAAADNDGVQPSGVAVAEGCARPGTRVVSSNDRVALGADIPSRAGVRRVHPMRTCGAVQTGAPVFSLTSTRFTPFLILLIQNPEN